ncbi:hypothetical protein T492DRAFT_1081924 [Pavlovales sp. CCMP2436]|nr:hypothetical protein T492DRAFT_1081924 [Pavlovales sp. CCMP2436]|mmetsp:Transcript_44593/g.110548  ORF Transcript_44593/g.110548 Transcript_44593/m.110548 type:complete len:198 (-) Transcript_44593:141-734(-)|eukprot:CAMPEP_0179877462 /NCGR_PEP_ID=MMETSP0982-20121206/24804_1 /TAXON_ID=483367 /ORGANISM="non described non described, Strain CCMP 2436" /LENGTH=197 /DNA_ID=CAMNT_0021770065 /DNA_START=21 /DNA_END=614 /DNA_ORIENTATION=+
MRSLCVLVAGLAAVGSFHVAPPLAPCMSTVRHSAVHASRVRMEVESPHPWSSGGSSAAKDSRWTDDELPQPLPVEMRPAKGREPRDVIMLVLNALRRPNEPYEHYGPQVSIAHSAPSNGASQLKPAQFAKYLAEPSYLIFSEWDEMEIEDDLQISDEGAQAYQEVLVKRADDVDWTHINWTLVQYDGMWMTESVVTF